MRSLSYIDDMYLAKEEDFPLDGAVIIPSRKTSPAFELFP